MVGSSSSIATSTYTLNTIVSDALCDIADKLEKSSNPIEEAWNIIRENMKNHKKLFIMEIAIVRNGISKQKKEACQTSNLQ